ncbi:endoplasmic reticulum protein [Coprinopsis cinerea AmutBmut pab1-1]|nr:endoplasmic reticulum protein [Coprinopsis cinerea AmutBmut pab1-1]KAG2010184.1 endoplasmic reticulum protein [Coprinopsis cinerea AmutBmut pab1-1]
MKSLHKRQAQTPIRRLARQCPWEDTIAATLHVVAIGQQRAGRPASYLIQTTTTMPVGIEAWITQIPPITRCWLALAVFSSLAVQCQIVTPLQLYHSWKITFLNGQPWRAITNFFYFGPLSLDFVFHLFFFMRYSRMLEESSFANRKADYFWMLFLSAIMLLGISPLFNLPFLSSPLAFVPIYVWSRRHPSTPISLFGLITISAPYLPIALVGFSWILHGTWKAAAGDLLGCAVGHVGWFMRDVWSREMIGGPTIFSHAPVRVRRLFGDA